MNVSFEIPQDIEQQRRSEGIDPNREAREAYLVELYRQRKITHHQLSQVLGLDRFDTDAVLKRHGVGYDLTLAEFREEVASLREAGSK